MLVPNVHHDKHNIACEAFKLLLPGGPAMHAQHMLHAMQEQHADMLWQLVEVYTRPPVTVNQQVDAAATSRLSGI